EVDQRSKRRCRREGQLVHAGPRDVAADAEQLGPGRVAAPNPRERRSAAKHDLRNVRQRFDVVDDSWQTEQPSLRGKGRLVARLAAIAFDRVEDRRLLATDVRAGAAADLDIEAHPAPKNVVAQK